MKILRKGLVSVSTATTPEHVRWFIDTNDTIKLNTGEEVKVFEFRHENNDSILSNWAIHFREHYCSDSEVDFFRDGTGLSRADFLKTMKFPGDSKAPGPSIRSGDFAEILVADYLEYILGFWVPRTRYGTKTIRNESSKGCDSLGFKIITEGVDNLEDTLAIFEAKASFSGKKIIPRLQNAVDDSVKDQIRKAESLNAIKQRLFDKGRHQDALKVQRFQNPVDRPYTEIFGAVALFSSNLFSPDEISETSTDGHPTRETLQLLVIHGADMMNLVHELYRRAADEA